MDQMLRLDLGVDRLVTGLHEVTEAFAAAVEGLDPQATVPTCPEWRVRDLVGHIGQAYRWSGELVRSRAAAPTPQPRAAELGPPREWAGWLRESTDDLVAAVTEVGPETVVWTFLGDRPARFWLRRMLADSVVHLADAAAAAGRPFAVAPDLAADAISEGLELIAAAGAAALKPDLVELRGDGQTLQWRAGDAAPGWLITRGHGGVTWERRTADADVVVAGPVAELLLVFSRRARPEEARVAVSGDRALLEHWRARTVF